MKRFWKDVSVIPEDKGWTILLDGRPVRTPARASLLIPTEALAEAIAEEWQAVGTDIDPQAMPLTGLANAAIDRIEPELTAFAGGIARYGEADLACYRSDWPPDLVSRQAERWDELIAWGRRRYDVEFCTTSGLLHVPQPQATVNRLEQAVAELDSFHLAGLSPLVTIGGSLLAALAVLEKAMTPEDAWNAVSVDDRWQLEQWGDDPEAVAALENRERDFMAAARFLELLDV